VVAHGPSTNQTTETYYPAKCGSQLIDCSVHGSVARRVSKRLLQFSIRIYSPEDTSEYACTMFISAGLTMSMTCEQCRTTVAPTAVAKIACTSLRV
jgi:hypothetical protein